MSASTTSAASASSAPSAVAGQRAGHELAPARARRRVGARDAAHDHARAAARRRAARQQRRAGHPRRSADDEHARRPLVPVGRASRQAEIGRLEHVQPRPPGRHARRRRCRCRRRAPDPACVRPGSKSSPGLSAAKHTVSCARTASPRTSPVAPSTPDGMSTASVGTPVVGERAGPRSAASPSSAPRNPVPNIASIARSARASARRNAGSSTPSASASSSTPTPRARRRRAATTPSAPLLPLPHTTTTRRPYAPPSMRNACRATALPARSTSTASGVPAAIVRAIGLAHLRGGDDGLHAGFRLSSNRRGGRPAR